MDENLGQDLELSHNILNYLHANFQGQFACLNLLSQLGFHEFNPDSVAECQSNISYIEKLINNLHQGIPIFSNIWKSPQTQDAKEVMLLLKYSKKELIAFASKIEKILIEPTHVDLENQYASLLPQAEKNVEAAHLFFDIYTGEAEVPAIFFRSLFEEGLFLPGVLRTTVHDFYRFSATYSGTFDYPMTDIPADEAEEWQVINIDPIRAGYWHAFTMSARDFVEWVQIGVTVPRTAWFWKCLLFEASEAAPWFRFGFQPPTAREWVTSNFTAEEAVEHINRGLTNPKTAREDGKRFVDEE